jgi:hypothetical protein
MIATTVCTPARAALRWLAGWAWRRGRECIVEYFYFSIIPRLKTTKGLPYKRSNPFEK